MEKNKLYAVRAAVRITEAFVGNKTENILNIQIPVGPAGFVEIRDVGDQQEKPTSVTTKEQPEVVISAKDEPTATLVRRTLRDTYPEITKPGLYTGRRGAPVYAFYCPGCGDLVVCHESNPYSSCGKRECRNAAKMPEEIKPEAEPKAHTRRSGYRMTKTHFKVCPECGRRKKMFAFQTYCSPNCGENFRRRGKVPPTDDERKRLYGIPEDRKERIAPYGSDILGVTGPEPEEKWKPQFVEMPKRSQRSLWDKLRGR